MVEFRIYDIQQRSRKERTYCVVYDAGGFNCVASNQMVKFCWGQISCSQIMLLCDQAHGWIICHVAHETAICHIPLIHSFTGHRKTVADAQLANS
jgi:hypothetical protein